jgi:hypothetical protein
MRTDLNMSLRDLQFINYKTITGGFVAEWLLCVSSIKVESWRPQI